MDQTDFDKFSKLLDDKLSPIIDKLKNLEEKVSKIVEIEKSLSFLSAKYDDLLVKIKNLEIEKEFIKKENVRLSSEVQGLFNEMYEVKRENNNIAQYTRRDTLEISGIPVCDEEETNNLVCQVGKLVDVNIEEGDISVSHRLHNDKSKTNHFPAIIVKFVRRDLRDELFNAKNRLRNKSTKDLGFLRHPQHKIFLNESLTPQNRALFKQCLRAKKDLNFKFIWTKFGKISLRKNGSSPAINILTQDDVRKLYENDDYND